MDCPEAVILKIDIDVPEYVREIAGKLVDSGYQAYVVGGAVRDSLIGRTPSDWDISSSATPREVEKIFGDRAIPTGERFGTMTVLSKDHAVEVTTFRCESRYSDGRRPDMVIFSESLRDDVERRDFTINALAYDIGQETVTDYFGGMNDLKEMTIRTVGKPRERFTEDSLRMLRAIRFAVELGFGISPETLFGIAKLHSTITRVSPERIQDELSKMLLSTRPGRAMEYSHETHLLDHILPELSDCANIPAYHGSLDTLLRHSIKACENTEPRLELRLAALLHDIGKPLTIAPDESGRIRFFNHENVGAELAEIALGRLRYPGALIHKVTTLIKWHMFTYESATSDKGIRRLVNSLGIDTIYDLAHLRQADRVALGLDPDPGSNMKAFLKRVNDVLEQGPVFTVNDLAVDGFDVMKLLDMPEGPEVGRVLTKILDMVLEEPGLNSRDRLLGILRKMADKKTE